MSIIRCSLVFTSLLLHIFGEPTPIGFNGNSAAGSLGGGSLSAPSFSQELLEPCVSILDVFEFLAVDDAICSGLARAGQLRV
jgi:predicted outer membrane repeat protein